MHTTTNTATICNTKFDEVIARINSDTWIPLHGRIGNIDINSPSIMPMTNSNGELVFQVRGSDGTPNLSHFDSIMIGRFFTDNSDRISAFNDGR